MAVEEENGRMKAELAEQKARSKAEQERLKEEISTVQRSKEVELDEIHQRYRNFLLLEIIFITQIFPYPEWNKQFQRKKKLLINYANNMKVLFDEPITWKDC